MGRLLNSLAVSAALLGLATGSAHAGDPAAGAHVFQSQCAQCHTLGAGKPNGIGPNLTGVAGRRAGSLAGYSYSKAMKSSGLTWTDDNLKKYLSNPSGVVSGNKMPFVGLKNPQKLDDLVAFLKTQH